MLPVSTKHIAVVADDIESDETSLKNFCEQLGFSVVCAKTYDKIAVLQEPNPPKVVILCAELISENGYLVCRKIRKNSALKQCHVIITSAAKTCERDFKKHRGLKNPANAYFKKPLDLEEFGEHLLAAQLLPDLQSMIGVKTDSSQAGEAHQAELAQAKDTIGKLNEKLTTLETQLKDAGESSKQVVELRQQAKSLSAKIGEVELELSGAQSELKTLEKSNQELQDSLALEKDKQSNLQSQIESLIQEKDEQAQRSQNENKKALDKLRDFYKRKLATTEKQLEKTKGQANNSVQETAEMKEQLDKFKERIKALREEIRAATAEHKKIEDELEKERAFRKRISSALQDGQ